MQWISTKVRLPKKPGKYSYEHVDCLIRMEDGSVLRRPWNCEHEVWDDEDGDDFAFRPTEPAYWMAVADLPTPPEGE